MTKTLPEIAKSILERRNRMTFAIMPGEIRNDIGPDGVSEALSRRWLVPDTESGFLCAASDLATISEMRKLAEMPPEQWKPDALPVAESHDLAIAHTKRGHLIVEIAAPMTGQPSPGLSSVAQPGAPQPQPIAAPSSQPNAAQPYQVGVSVATAREGARAQGVIEKLLPDGRFQVGFPPGQPKPSGDNIFSKEELSAVPAAPGAPAAVS